ncbi:MAG TPA: amidohydrolase family protein [Xanthobacteraceae bacterium]|nr:amidohydrolase family protein [Xanthobacteraceae bacterium]
MGQSPRSSSARKKPVVIDFHAHFMTPEVFEATYKLSVIGRLRAQADGKAVRPFPQAQIARMTDLKLRLAAMDEMGVDVQVISPNILHQCTYGLEPQDALRLERLNNDHAAELVAQKPDRLIGIGSVPLQNVEMAIHEMERAVLDLKLKGIIIASRINETDLGDPALRPFWSRAQALDVPIFVHPAGNADPRLQKHSLLISLGQPLEEAFAQTSLIYDGVMDEFPRLKIAFAHGGGFIPYYAGRFDWIYHRGSTPQMKSDFSTYLRTFRYDTVLFNPDVLEQLATKVDGSHIMLGSDFPFGEAKPVEFVQSAAKIPAAVRDAIMGANTARFLGVDI